jgi:hypothetical protein
MELPSRMLRPILPSPRYLDVEEIDGDKDGMPKIGKRLVLLDCDLAEADVQRDYPSLWAYLQEGIAKGVNERYLCKHRQPWYSQENRDPAPFLCTYMGRHKEGKATFRFILNHSMATAANVYLLLYPKPRLARAIGTSKEKRRQVWEALCSIDTSSITDVGRVYGGGLHKVEPKELANAPAQEVLEAVPEAKPAQGTLFSM